MWIMLSKMLLPRRVSMVNLHLDPILKMTQLATTVTKTQKTKMDRHKKLRATPISANLSNRTSRAARTSFWWTTSRTQRSPAQTTSINTSLLPKLNNCCFSSTCYSNSIKWINCNCSSNSDNSSRAICPNSCKRRSQNSISRSTSYKIRRYRRLFLGYFWISRSAEQLALSKITQWILPHMESQTSTRTLSILRKVPTPWEELTPRKTRKWISWAASEVLWHPILKMRQALKVEIRTPASQFLTQITGTAGSEVLAWAADLRKMCLPGWSSHSKLNRALKFSRTNRNRWWATSFL